jgi:hypothetical protein
VTAPLGSPPFFTAEPLLTDDDLTSFQFVDPAWFLAVATDTVRNYCQWHIAPPITETNELPIQPDGTIMVPTQCLTDVADVTINGLQINPATYQVHQEGWISQIQQNYQAWPLWPLDNDHKLREYPSATGRFATVTYTHGYASTPPAVAGVIAELYGRATELPSGIATELTAGPNTIKLGALGQALSDEQRRRLGPFCIIRF